MDLSGYAVRVTPNLQWPQALAFVLIIVLLFLILLSLRTIIHLLRDQASQGILKAKGEQEQEAEIESELFSGLGDLTDIERNQVRVWGREKFLAHGKTEKGSSH